MTISIIGGSGGAGSGDLSLAWPPGSAAGDVAVLIASDNGDPVVPAGWTSGDAATKTLSAGDLSGPLTADTSTWYGALAVLRGVAASSLAGVNLGYSTSGATTFNVAPVGGHAGPMGVLYLVLAICQPGQSVDLDAGMTDLGIDILASTGGAFPPTFPSGMDNRLLLPGLAQTTAGDTPSFVLEATSGATWWQVSGLTFDEPAAGSSNDVAFHVGGATITLHATGGDASAGGVTFHGGGTITTGVLQTDYPAPAPPAPEDVDLEAGDDADVIERISDVWDAPTLVDGVPVDWEMS